MEGWMVLIPIISSCAAVWGLTWVSGVGKPDLFSLV